MQKAANWVYTWNNPNVSMDDHHASFHDVNPVYHVFQREVGENGTEHFQGYLEFLSAKSLRALKACNPQIHWEKRRGSQQQAIAYSTKEDTRKEGPWTFGDPKSTAKVGMSADFVDQIKAGKRVRELLETHVDDIRKYPRFYQQVRTVYAPPVRDSAPEVVLLYGPPGTGKTRYVRETESIGDLFIKPVDKSFWMDGYDGHPAILLDDFSGAANHVSLVNLLQLIDRYQMQVPIKGGFTWWQPDRIYLTTNVHPADWYTYQDRMCHYEALKRRFTSVIEFTATTREQYNPLVLLERPKWDKFWDFQSHHVRGPPQ